MPLFRNVTITLSMKQADACLQALGIGVNTLAEAKEKHGRLYIGPNVHNARGGLRILERTIANLKAVEKEKQSPAAPGADHG